MQQVTMFWGCTIPARLAFIEKSARIVLADLGIHAVDIPGFTCCPEEQLTKTADESAYYLTAARNLALAREQGLPLLTPCSGCYSTFKHVSSRLKSDWRLARQMAGRLSVPPGSTTFQPLVWHIAEWLCDELGPSAVRKRVRRPLWGMRVAIHYGCHLLRPTPAVRWDSSTAPSKLERLIQALGATVTEYETKMLCCGSALGRAGDREGSLQLLSHKLKPLKERGVDALVVACPACFLQFDLNQVAAARMSKSATQDEPEDRKEPRETLRDNGIPVFYLTELLALALGHRPEHLALDLHRTPVSPFLTKWAKQGEVDSQLSQHFDLSKLRACAECRACDAECPMALTESGAPPSEVVSRLLGGDLERLLLEQEPWRCLACLTCLERCHSGWGLAWVFDKLKSLARQRGRAPSALRAGYEDFCADGVVGEARFSVRERLGLPSLPPSGGPELLQVLKAGVNDRSTSAPTEGDGLCSSREEVEA